MGCESADDEDDVMQAVLAISANEIECLAKVFEFDVAKAKKYYEEAVPARNGTCFEAAANSIIAEYVAEIMEYVDKRATRKLHKMKQVVMKRMSCWDSCRRTYFAFVSGRDKDPVGDAFSSCFELVDNREMLPCVKKGCCSMQIFDKQSGTSIPSAVHSNVALVVMPAAHSVAPSGGKAKVVYTGKAKA